MCNVLKWRIVRLESKINSLESEKSQLKRRLLTARGAKEKWQNNSFTTQTPKNPSTLN